MKNVLSIDLESWIHFYKDSLKLESFGLTSSEKKMLDNDYIPKSTIKILNLLDKYNQKATFFIIGEIYDWYPKIIDEIKKRGHEIAYHTHSHPILTSGKILEKELRQSKKFINKFKPIGFRAPQIFITKDSFAHLKKYGFKYSSSTYDDKLKSKINGVDEIPVSTISFRGKRKYCQKLPKSLSLGMLFKKIPFGSGLFISIIGSYTSKVINYLNKKDVPMVLFIHPWQLCKHKKIDNFKFKLKILFRNPLCFPYTRNIWYSIEKLLKRHEFLSFEEYYYGKQKILE